jgi:hypothetical protein
MSFFEKKIIIFQSIFDDEKFSQLFFNFLKKENNTEPFEFVKDLNSLKEGFDSYKKEDLVSKLLNVHELYLKDDSKKEVNLGHSDKTLSNNVFLKIKNCKIDDINEKTLNEVMDVLANISRVILKEMQADR